MQEAFSKTLGIEVIALDLSEGILAEEHIKTKLKEKVNLLAAALGLGLRDD
jgi:hypothetical protein